MTTNTQPIQLTDVSEGLVKEIEFFVEDIHGEKIAHKSSLKDEIAQLLFDEKLSAQTTDYAFYVYSTMFLNTNHVMLNGQEKGFDYNNPFEIDPYKLGEVITDVVGDIINNLQDPTQYFSVNVSNYYRQSTKGWVFRLL